MSTRGMERLSDQDLWALVRGTKTRKRERAYAKELLLRRFDKKRNATLSRLWLSIVASLGVGKALIARMFANRR